MRFVGKLAVPFESAHSHGRQVLVIAPHADDEVIGCGGTIARLTGEGTAVDIVVLGLGGVRHRQHATAIETAQRRCELDAAAAVLGVRSAQVLFTGQEMRLETMPQVEIVTALDRVLDAVRYDEVFLPPRDHNADHRATHDAAMAALRLGARPPPALVAGYESAPESPWAADRSIAPALFVNVSDQWAIKIKALRCYASQVRDAPHPRSSESLTRLAAYRGVQCGAAFAEAFVVWRLIR